MLAKEGAPALSHGTRAGERLPDAPVRVQGQESTLQREVVGACFTLLVCVRGARGAGTACVDDGRGRGVLPADLLRVRRLVSSEASTHTADVLVDESGVALERLWVRDSAIYLVRPDGYVAYRCAGTDFGGVDRWIEEALAT